MLSRSNPLPKQTACRGCGLEHQDIELPPGGVAHCVRCDSELYRHPRLSLDFLASISLAGLVCWALAASLPLARAQTLGAGKPAMLLSIGSSFRENGQLALGLAADLFIVILPTLLLILLPLFAILALRGGAYPKDGSFIKMFSFAKRWAMPEVLLLAILIAFIKVDEVAPTAVEAGFWFLAASVCLLTIAIQVFPLDKAERADASPTAGRRKAWAYLVAAGVMLVPANLLPIMIVSTPGQTSSDTILSGIARLAEEGTWAIAAIVFIASIAVPLTKLGGLAGLILLSHRKSGGKFATKAYRFLDFIGRWSMLDIFLIGFLAALIDFGALASVKPGPAAPAFAAAVILTVIAVESFDTRSLWPTRNQT